MDKHLEVNDKLNQEDKNKKKLLLLNDGLNPLDDTEELKSYDISTILLDYNKINPYEIFKSIKEIDELLYAIIEKIFTGFDETDDDETNKIKSMLEKAINACFKDNDDLKDKDISFTDMKENDYIKLYKNISENFKAFLNTQKLDEKISKEKEILLLLEQKIDELKEKINQNITSDHESTDFKEKFANADKTIDENEKKAAIEKELNTNKDTYAKIYNEADKKIKELNNTSYTREIINYQNTNNNIVELYNELKKKIEGSDKVKKFENDIKILENLIINNKEKFTNLDSIYYKVVEIINEANEKITGLGANEGIFKLFSKPSKQVYEGLRNGVLQNQSHILTSDIPNYIALLKSDITIEEKVEEDARKKEAQMKQQEWEDQDTKDLWLRSGGLGTGSTRAGGGGNNTKELRQKLNTMSIKQLKRLSDKKYIEYGKKNTIKSLINNYMKHI
tara:strand:- start:22 stop:1371 length:1350 start_codon:yes stop_codon:yes gene_type:complete